MDLLSPNEVASSSLAAAALSAVKDAPIAKAVHHQHRYALVEEPEVSGASVFDKESREELRLTNVEDKVKMVETLEDKDKTEEKAALEWDPKGGDRN